MHRPDFWYPQERRLPWPAFFFLPLSLVWQGLGCLRALLAKTWKAPCPVICVGNAVVGGTGKTPIVLALAHDLVAKGVNVHIVSYGYRGRRRGPLRVDPKKHDYRDVGDEALLLAQIAPTWIGRNRAAAIARAAENGADLVLVDDGLQNPHFFKDLSFLVMDAQEGFGNGALVPAGPLRERPETALNRADALIVMGKSEAGQEIADRMRLMTKPVIEARLAPAVDTPDIRGRRLIAFAGIGRPEKFARQLRELGGEVIELCSFDDHHIYNEADADRLLALAISNNASLITTEKDRVRLPQRLKNISLVFPVRALFKDRELISNLIKSLIPEKTA